MKNKNKTTRITTFLIFAVSLSLLFISCGDNKAYNKAVSTADSLFNNQNYDEAKTHYLKALELKKDETYPTGQITKIDELKAKKIDFNYSAKIEQADAFLANKEYNNAKRAYVDAGNIKPSEAYPKAKIREIEEITNPKTVTAPSLSYHVIAGSYAIESNATALQKKFNDEGRTSTIERSRNGNYLVSLQSFATINEAYNYLITLEDDFDTSIWVYRIK